MKKNALILKNIKKEKVDCLFFWFLFVFKWLFEICYVPFHRPTALSFFVVVFEYFVLVIDLWQVGHICGYQYELTLINEADDI